MVLVCGKFDLQALSGLQLNHRTGLHDVLLSLRMRVSAETIPYCQPRPAGSTARSRKCNTLSAPSARIGRFFFACRTPHDRKGQPAARENRLATALGHILGLRFKRGALSFAYQGEAGKTGIESRYAGYLRPDSASSHVTGYLTIKSTG